jgi:hypothetical protein
MRLDESIDITQPPVSPSQLPTVPVAAIQQQRATTFLIETDCPRPSPYSITLLSMMSLPFFPPSYLFFLCTNVSFEEYLDYPLGTVFRSSGECSSKSTAIAVLCIVTFLDHFVRHPFIDISSGSGVKRTSGSANALFQLEGKSLAVYRMMHVL